jgi:hypothetical protein
MKKLFLASVLLVFGSAVFSQAQVMLSGTEYVQHFDSLLSGLPVGWSVDTNAKANTTGGAGAALWVPGTGTRWSNVTGSFKNVASANSFLYWAAATSTAQASATDRALAVRQTSGFGDPGASFSFLVNHTYKLSNFGIEFKLQSLDSSNGSKISKWVLQYGIGKDPDTFFTVTGSPMYTGGNLYSNTKYTFSFGRSLDDVREPVRIRIVSLDPSTGSGSRTMTALDDLRLYWTGIAHSGGNPFVQSLYPKNGDPNVPEGAVLQLTFDKKVNKGRGNLYIWNETDGTAQTMNVSSSNVSVFEKVVKVSGVRFKPGHDYHVTFDSSIVDSAGAVCFPITDTAEWRFHCVAAPYWNVPEYFDTACVRYLSAPGWYQFNKMGPQQWDCATDGAGNTVMRIYANDGSVDVPNRDWLIAPLIDLAAGSPDILVVHHLKSSPDNVVDISISTDYCGSGDPELFTWSYMGSLGSSGVSGVWERGAYKIPASYLGQRCYLGFFYASGYDGATEVEIDSISLLNSASIEPVIKSEFRNLRVANPTEGDNLQLFFNPFLSAELDCYIYGMDGILQWKRSEKINPGCSSHTLSNVPLSPGLYLLKVIAEGRVEWCRFAVQ